MKLQGSFVALVTPYANGEVDLPKVRELVEFHIKNGTAGICPETTARLALIKNIVALKDASGNVEQVTQLRAISDIQILSGEDSLTFSILCLGGVGVVSVAANVIPKQVAEMTAAAVGGELT